jgi:hypothetical protein
MCYIHHPPKKIKDTITQNINFKRLTMKSRKNATPNNITRLLQEQEGSLDTSKCGDEHIAPAQDVIQNRLVSYALYNVMSEKHSSSLCRPILGASTPTSDEQFPNNTLIPIARLTLSSETAQEKIQKILKPLEEKQKIAGQWFTFLAAGAKANRKKHASDTDYSPASKLFDNKNLSDPHPVLNIRSFLSKTP